MAEITETKKRTSRRGRGASQLSFDDFDPHEQALLTLTAREKGLSIPDLMAEAIREYLSQNVKIQINKNGTKT
ncbi:MAG: hypothetical protein HY282_06925 [Nitrospirae bacterium]|nr:hypothetical protein [Candidatus Manganitrophaceae bacterium]